MSRLRDFSKRRVFETHMGTWARFWRLENRARRIVAEAFAVIVATEIGLRIAGFHRWKGFLERNAAWLRESSDSTERRISPLAAPEMARLVHSTANALFVRVSCLERSLALRWMLQRRGLAVDLRMGARKQGSRFEAHAWIECDGLPIAESERPRGEFAPFCPGGSTGLMAKETR